MKYSRIQYILTTVQYNIVKYMVKYYNFISYDNAYICMYICIRTFRRI